MHEKRWIQHSTKFIFLQTIPQLFFLISDDIISFRIGNHKICGVHGHNDQPSKIIANLSLMTEEHYDLILAGHSHNGQAKLPFIKPFYLPNNAKNYYDNYYKVENTDIYISNGVRNSIVDFRLFSTPSINVYRLNAK